jgi:hypothetical protein
LLNAPAGAETCQERFPGSCRVEVSTTVLQAPGQVLQRSTPIARQGKRVRQGKPVRHAKSVRHTKLTRHAKRAAAPAPQRARGDAVALRVSVPVPVPHPTRQVAIALEPKPVLLVDDAFNVLTIVSTADSALEEALLNRRDQMLGQASRWPD